MLFASKSVLLQGPLGLSARLLKAHTVGHCMNSWWQYKYLFFLSDPNDAKITGWVFL